MSSRDVIAAVFGFFVLLVLAGSISAWTEFTRRIVSGLPALPFQRRRSVPWGFDGIILTVGIFVLLVSIFMGLATQADWVQAPTATDGKEISLSNSSRLLQIEATARIASCILVTLWIATIYRASSFDLGWRLRRQDLLVGLVATLALLPPVFLLQALLTLFVTYEHPVLELLDQSADFQFFLPMAFVAVFVAPVTEEFFFRVVLQGWLERRSLIHDGLDREMEELQGEASVPYWPILVSSTLFAAVHMGQGPAPITLFFLSLGLGYLYRQTHSIWPSLVVHFSLNAITMTVAAIHIFNGDPLTSVETVNP